MNVFPSQVDLEKECDLIHENNFRFSRTLFSGIKSLFEPATAHTQQRTVRLGLYPHQYPHQHYTGVYGIV